MIYKIEIRSTRIFPDQDIFNNLEESFFEDDEPLSARQNAFDYLLSLSPIANTTLNIALFIGYDHGVYDELCAVCLWPLEDYDANELSRRDFYLDFNIDNLHNERAAYEEEKCYAGGIPIILDDYEATEYNDETDSEIMVPAKILAANRKFFKPTPPSF